MNIEQKSENIFTYHRPTITNLLVIVLVNRQYIRALRSDERFDMLNP